MKFCYRIMAAAAGIAALAGCSKEPAGNGGSTGETNGALAAPQVEVKMGTASMTAEWTPVDGAYGYRCEVTYIVDGKNADVLKTNITETSFTLTALRPKTTFTVRVAATGKDGKASRNWFMKDFSTGALNVTFDIKPYEIYNTTTGHIDYLAKVVPSDKEIWYWIGAVPYDQRLDAKLWMTDEIADCTDNGLTWDSLVDAGYIVKGDSESTFVFNSGGEYMFTAGVLEHQGDNINVVSEVSLSYPFRGENASDMSSHECSWDDYIGEWVVMPYDRADYSSSEESWNLTDPEPFNVVISAKEAGKTLKLSGWGGAKNRFGIKPVVLDYAPADEQRFEHFTISLPQEIESENGIKWIYTSWFTLTKIDEEGNEVPVAFTPYDIEYDRTLGGSVRKSFRGYIANANKSIIKILGNTFKSDDLAIYMQSLWVCGTDNSGSYNFSDTAYSLNGDRGGIPNSTYYLVRKDVAEGKELLAPDLTEDLENTKAPQSGYIRGLFVRSR